MDYNKLAELLFPQIDKTPEDYEAMFPQRANADGGAVITRLGPSPTGFIHLGNLYGAFVDERLAHQSKAEDGTPGTFYLRIEDTDDKRYVEGAVDTVINSLKFFDINFDEGAGCGPATADGEPTDSGDYGPYYQSERGPIYQAFVKHLVSQGKAYPCFLTEEELAEIRAQQEAAKETTGIYGKYAEKSRNLSYEEIEANINAGKPYVVRLKSKGNAISPENCCMENGATCQGNSGNVTYSYDIQELSCVNEPNIGGVAGYVEGSMADCINSGNISVKAPEFSGSNATKETYYLRCSKIGGVAGTVAKGISGCSNSGEISLVANISNGSFAEYVGSISNPCLGGVVGEGPLTGGTSDCHNSGAISIHTTKCYNSGAILFVGGVTGYTASIVAKKLREISQSHQIVCITHLPQIAAAGDHNYKIYKESDDAATFTHLECLDDETKVMEIARLMGGATITDNTLKSAKELIDNQM